MRTQTYNDDGSCQASEGIINNLLPLPSAEAPTRTIREIWRERFTENGWISNYFIPESRQSITLWKDMVGVCIQLGNTCRASTDLLKLETLFRLNRIEEAALVVPSKTYAGFLGSNHASFATAARDLSTFAPAITVPVTLIEFHPKDLKA